MGIVDRLQALDDRFLPARLKPKPPVPPPEWTPEVGPLAPVTARLERLAGAFAVGGSVLLAFDVIQEGWKVLVFTPIFLLVHGLVLPLFSREQVRGSFEQARPVAADVPRGGRALSCPALMAAAALMLVGIALSAESIGIPGGAVLGGALTMAVQVRWLLRWEHDHEAELLAPRQCRLGGGLYRRPRPAGHRADSFSGR